MTRKKTPSELRTVRQAVVERLRADGLTQVEIAKICGVSQPQVCRDLESSARRFERLQSDRRRDRIRR